ncbi:MAG: ferredoxin [Deltaproteobacteria bacterium]|nr:ferredoxin [Deltaproteobacteria bacterium]
MPTVPVVDMSQCSECESCLVISPTVFRRNNETGLIEVVELPEYPESEILEAISICPADCITREEVP